MNKILNITIGVLVLSLAALGVMAATGGNTQQVAQNDGQVAGHVPGAWQAVWYYTPTSVQEAYGFGAVAVLATVDGVEQASELVVPAKGEPDGVDRIPNQTIRFSVNEVYKGSIAKSFALFHTGDSERWADDDPAYAAGEQYVLFLLPRDDGRWVLVSPEGRYQVVNGAVQPASHFPAVAAVAGTALEAFRSQMAAAPPATK